MATARTGTFYLTETVTLNNGTAAGQRVQGSVDLGAYVSVADGLAIAIESVDFVYQVAGTLGGNVGGMLAASGTISTQLTDLNPGTALVQADNQSLIASGALNIDKSNVIASHSSDMFPDNFGPAALSEAFMVVNDTLYLVAGPDTSDIGTSNVLVTARIRARIVKLAQKDWVAIAIQSTASDN
jgi:hypothetical protein